MTDVFEQLRACRVVPVVKFPNAECAEGLGRALLAAGLPCIEVTFRSAAAEAAIRTLSTLPGLLVGAGTIRSVRRPNWSRISSRRCSPIRNAWPSGASGYAVCRGS